MAAAAGAAHAKRVAETAARIFGNWIGNGQRSGRKVLRQKMIGEEIASYYMEPIKDPLLEDPMEARRKLKLDRLRRRGKSPPKKGEGKRASKK